MGILCHKTVNVLCPLNILCKPNKQFSTQLALITRRGEGAGECHRFDGEIIIKFQEEMTIQQFLIGNFKIGRLSSVSISLKFANRGARFKMHLVGE